MTALVAVTAFAAILAALNDSPISLRVAQGTLFSAFFLLLFLENGKQKNTLASSLSWTGREIFISFFFITGLAFLTYFGILGMRFLDADNYIHLMDARSIVQNRTLSHYLDFFVFVKSNDAEQLVRPLLNIPFVIGYLFFGTNSVGYHLLNVLAHGLAGFLISLILYLVSDKIKLGILAGALYVAHPVLSRPVAWTAALTHTFPTFYFLAAIFFYLLYRRKNQKTNFLILAWVFMTIDMAAWELGFLLPVLFVAFDLIFFRQKIKTLSKAQILKPYLITFCIVGIYGVQILLRIWILDIDVGRQYMEARLTTETGLPILAFLNTFVDGLFRPFHSGVFFGLSYKVATTLWIFGLCAVLAVIVMGKKFNGRIVALGYFFALLTYLPILGSPQGNMEFLMRARVLMLPVIGFSFVLATLLYPTKKQPGRFSLFLVLAIPFIFASLAAANNIAWKNIAQRQEKIESQLQPILEKHDSSNPLVVLLAADLWRDMDFHRDIFETLYARLQYESPDSTRHWYLTYQTYITFTPHFESPPKTKSKWPTIITTDKNLSEFKDDTDILFDWVAGYIKGGIDIYGQKYLIAPGNTLHRGWPQKELDLGHIDEHLVTLDAKIHTISPERMRLHIPLVSK